MLTIKQTEEVSLKTSLKLYFTDFGFSKNTVYGNSWVKTCWIISCYTCFSLGVYARQIVSFLNTDITVNTTKNNLSTLFGAFIVGLAIFPFALRTITKLVTRMYAAEPLKERGKLGFNIMHLITSFAIGFFFNLVANYIPEIIEKMKF